jgi:sugar O-acyltransferase (sialic acid O-acetyltransferase NeuD family)
MPLARAQLEAAGVVADLVFVDDQPAMDMINGHRVLTYTQFLDEPAGMRYAALAIANSTVRQKLSERLVADGVTSWAIRAGNVVSMDAIYMMEGSILSPFVTLTSNIRIGRQFHANIYSYVAHDCVIGDFVTFAPGVMCNGNVVIEDHAYIGTGAVLKQGRPGQPLVIGRGAVVGMGAVVTRDVAPGTTVVGNPARLLIKS